MLNAFESFEHMGRYITMARAASDKLHHLVLQGRKSVVKSGGHKAEN